MPTLNVVANPFQAVDHDGNPSGAVALDPDLNGGSRVFVGAAYDPASIKTLRPHVEGSPQTSRVAARFVFDTTPQAVPATPYFVRRIAKGELFAADRATARECGISDAEFREPAELLAASRARAFDSFKAETGREPRFTREDAPPAPPAPPAGEADAGA